MVDLDRAYELEHGITVNDIVMPESLLTKDGTFKLDYSGDDVSTVVYYKNSTQINDNRIAQVSFTYTNSLITSQLINYYKTDGVTIYQSETHTMTYDSNDNLIGLGLS